MAAERAERLCRQRKNRKGSARARSWGLPGVDCRMADLGRGPKKRRGAGRPPRRDAQCYMGALVASARRRCPLFRLQPSIGGFTDNEIPEIILTFKSTHDAGGANGQRFKFKRGSPAFCGARPEASRGGN